MDGRGAEGYNGSADDPRSGHIPDAVNVPFKRLLDPDTGTFLPDDKLAAVFDTQTPGWRTKPVISSCGSGYTATVLMLAMEHLGVRAPLYDGSFAEWKQDPARPVAQSF
jgi:thiosulfate/3-mercaptopyruvate sulfurtransferase